MIIRIFAVCCLLAAALALGGRLAQAAGAPDEKQCAAAIAAAQKTLREMPASTPRDKADLQKLKDQQEALITGNRSKGISDCRTWSEVMGLAARF
jgi:hypothetical protein